MKLLTRRYLVYRDIFCYFVTFHGDGRLTQSQDMKILVESGTREKPREPITLKGAGTVAPTIGQRREMPARVSEGSIDRASSRC